MQKPTQFRPTQPFDRVHLLDVLRGVALVGVLLINMEDTAGFSTTAEMTGFSGPVDETLDWLFRFFVEARFKGIFGLLFGIGFTLQIQRAKARGAPYLARYLRRSGLLLAFGLIHFLFYPGDILIRYAVLGLVLIPAYGLTDRSVLAVAGILMLSIPLLGAVTAESQLLGRRSTTALEESDFCLSQRQDFPGPAHVHASGTFLDVRKRMICRFPGEVRFWGRSLTPLSIFVMFLIGMVVGRQRLYREVAERRMFIRALVAWTAAIGFSLLAIKQGLASFGGGVQGNWSMSGIGSDALLEFGRLATTLAYAGLLALFFIRSKGRTFLMPFAAVGRMALTVYIGQSLIYSTLFSGYGMGLNEGIGRAGILGLTALIFTVEILVCNLWLRHFRYGPLEWLWRCLTYGEFLPIRATSVAAG